MAETFSLLIRADTAHFIWHEERKTNSTQRPRWQIKRWIQSDLIIKATMCVKGKLNRFGVSIKI